VFTLFKPEVSISALTRTMIDAHVHRAIVVDDENKPIGVVSSTDVWAAIAYAE
jgi:predicted transcriptional regulator